jgi:hypothetical protein
MKNEFKLAFVIMAILMVALGLGRAFHLSFNPQTFQVGYTVYTEKGEPIQGFIPEMQAKAVDSQCSQKCNDEPSAFAMQCRQDGHQVYTGSCCQSLCSGNVASANEGHTK